MRRSVGTVRSIVENQTNWLNETESSLQKMLQKNIIERYNKECSSVDRLINMIGDCIELAEPICLVFNNASHSSNTTSHSFTFMLK